MGEEKEGPEKVPDQIIEAFWGDKNFNCVLDIMKLSRLFRRDMKNLSHCRVTLIRF